VVIEMRSGESATRRRLPESGDFKATSNSCLLGARGCLGKEAVQGIEHTVQPLEEHSVHRTQI
jgi:hypothetical protein